MSMRLELASALGRSPGEYYRRLCGVGVACDTPLPALSPFQADPGSTAAGEWMTVPGVLCSGSPVRIETTGLVAGRERRVALRAGSGGARLEIEDLAGFSLSPDASLIRLERVLAGVTEQMIEECTLGAPVVLGLALRGRWIMHAAAIERCNGHVVLVAGPSGSGKSTAARYLDRFPECRRIADDLSGLHLGDDGLLAHADYPQLKLPPGSQPACSPLPVECIYILNPGQAGDGFSIRTLAGLDKLLTFPAHSVATRLFPADLLARHQAFCREAAASVPVVEVLYPRTAEGLRGLVDAITDTGRRSWPSPE